MLKSSGLGEKLVFVAMMGVNLSLKSLTQLDKKDGHILGECTCTMIRLRNRYHVDMCLFCIML